MKILSVTFLLWLICASCLKEDLKVKQPNVNGFEIFMTDSNGKDSVVSEVPVGSTVNIVVFSDADLCSLWLNDARIVMKKQGTSVDSIDMFGHEVLQKSNFYSDYGLVGARGLKTTRYEGRGWVSSYVYNEKGDFVINAVLTNHGTGTGDFKQIVEEIGSAHVY